MRMPGEDGSEAFSFSDAEADASSASPEFSHARAHARRRVGGAARAAARPRARERANSLGRGLHGRGLGDERSGATARSSRRSRRRRSAPPRDRACSWSTRTTRPSTRASSSGVVAAAFRAASSAAWSRIAAAHAGTSRGTLLKTNRAGRRATRRTRGRSARWRPRRGAPRPPRRRNTSRRWCPLSTNSRIEAGGASPAAPEGALEAPPASLHRRARAAATATASCRSSSGITQSHPGVARPPRIHAAVASRSYASFKCAAPSSPTATARPSSGGGRQTQRGGPIRDFAPTLLK